MKILLVEDDEGLLEILRQILISQHYLVECATDGLTGWELAETFDYDLILLDWMVPQLDGISLCQRLRAHVSASASTGSIHPNYNTPIILLTAKDSSAKRVMGLDAGADDYLVKPIDLQELLARIRALLRRGSGARSPILIWGNLSLNPNGCEVTCQNQRVPLTAKEYEMLELLMRNPHRIFSQRYLLEQLWQTEAMPTENTVRSHVKSLRQKLKQVGTEDVIETVYGLGYRLRGLEAIAEPQEGEEERKIAAVGKVEKVGEVGEIGEGLEAIWEKYRGQYGDRLQFIQGAIAALAEGSLDPALQQRARQEAHTLIGSLGSFNLHQAAQLARELEQHFKAPSLDTTQVRSLSELATPLAQIIQQVATSKRARSSQFSILSSQLRTQLSTQKTATMHRVTQLNTRKGTQTDPKSETQNPKLDLRILIVEDDPALATAIQTEAIHWGIQAAIAISPAAARAQMAESLPNGIVLDLTFPGMERGGLELLREWSYRHPTIPVIVFTAQEGLEERLEVARLGARMFLQKPIAATEVVNAIAQILQSVAPPTAKLLIVDDDQTILDYLQTLLHPWGFQITLLSDPHQFWLALEHTQPDLLMLDIEMADINGIDLCQVVRNDARWGDLPILILSVHQDAETITQVFTAGADDYVSKPIVGPELMARIINRLNRTHKTHSLITLKTVP